MKEQNFENHRRFVPGYHYVTLTAILLLLIGSFVNLFRSGKDNLYSASLICLIAFILVLVSWYLRSFALRAQDRAIRAEENFRHYILTGKPLPGELTLGQIIALRFAADDEFVGLVAKAIAEKLSVNDIKKAIQQWRADHHRA
jgi:ammonia channel protein AmtB